MDYSLPHAVMAFLQEEHSSNLPKSYFISSSTRTTKITLIYTRRKSNTLKPNKKKSMSNAGLLNNEVTKHRSSYSSSSTDDYTQKTHSVQPCKFDTCDHDKLNRRICASTPGRGYSGGMRTREMHRSQAAGKLATDPVVGNSPHKDHLSLRDFAANAEGHDDFDGEDNFGTLSPNSFGDRPPTPGRDLNSSISPRPPTPNANNYANLMSCSKSEQGHLHNRAYPAQSKQLPNEYGGGNFGHRTQNSSRRSNTENSNHHRRSGREEAAKQTESCRIPQQKLTGDNALFTLRPIATQSPSPDSRVVAGNLSYSKNTAAKR